MEYKFLLMAWFELCVEGNYTTNSIKFDFLILLLIYSNYSLNPPLTTDEMILMG